MANRIFYPGALILLCTLSGGAAGETFGEMRDRLNQLDIQQELLQRESQLSNARIQAEQARQRLSDARGDSGQGPMPSILAIMQVGDTWLAKLQTHDGIVDTYAVGDVAGFGVISSIDRNGVTVSHKKGGKIQKDRLRYLAPSQAVSRVSGHSPVTMQPASLWESLPRIPALEGGVSAPTIPVQRQ